MGYRLFSNFPERFLDANGDPLASGTVTFHLAGTTTLAAIYSDNAGTAAANPATLDANGQFSTAIWGDETISYKITVKNSGGSTIGPVHDNVTVGNASGSDDAQWITQPHTPTRLTNTTFELAAGDGDQTSKYHTGRRIKLTDSATLYGTIVKSDFNVTSASKTHVTVKDVLNTSGAATNLSASLSAVDLSLLTANNAALPSRIVSVKEFGAVGDGVEDDTTAIQAAIDAIEASGISGRLHFPAGTYKCTSGLTVDVSQVTMFGDAATLNFSTMTTGYGITVFGGGITYAGQPYYNGVTAIQGFKIIGGGKASSFTGIRFNDADTAGGNDITVRDVVISDCGTGLVIEDNSYHLSFEHMSIFACTTCAEGLSYSNSGARCVFVRTKFFNSNVGLSLKNGASANTSVTDCVFAGLSSRCIYMEGGNLDVKGTDFEAGPSQGSSYAVLEVNDAQFPVYSYITWSGNWVALKNAISNDLFILDSAVFLTILGGYIFANATITGAAVFGGGANGTGHLTIVGTWINKGSNTFDDMDASILRTYLLTDPLPNTLDVNLRPSDGKGISFASTSDAAGMTSEVLDDYEEGTFTPVIEGTSAAGTATYTRQQGHYQKIGNTVNFWIDVIWNSGSGSGNLKVTGLPYTSSSTTMLKPVVINAYDVTLTASNVPIATVGVSTTEVVISQSPTGGGSSSAVAYDAAGQLVIAGSYFV